MKTIGTLLITCFAALAVNAAELEWLTDLPKAQAKAKAENKLVFLEFTGSDWCPPCIRLKKEVLSTKEFAEFARKNLVLVEIDFPRRTPQEEALKAANRALSEKYKVEGFPTVILLDAQGKELKRDVGFGGENAKAYIAKLKKFRS